MFNAKVSSISNLPSLDRFTAEVAALALAELEGLAEKADTMLESPPKSEASALADPFAAADERVTTGMTTPPGPTVPVTVVKTCFPPASVVVIVEVTIGGKGNRVEGKGFELDGADLEIRVSVVLVSGLPLEVADGPIDAGVEPGAAVVREDAEALVEGNSDVDPGCRVIVMPSVVISTGLVFDFGRVIVSEPMTIMLGPRTMVLLPLVIVELVAPKVKVVPPSTTSVTDDTGRGGEEGLEDRELIDEDVEDGSDAVFWELGSDVGGVPGWKVIVMPAVEMTVCSVAEAGTGMVRVPITIALVPITICWLFLVMVKLWLLAGSVKVLPSKITWPPELEGSIEDDTVVD
jgi:hypothetical protein